jgi:fructose-1,6-bisphosphatase/inositol monophosphatase family enzyme
MTPALPSIDLVGEHIRDVSARLIEPRWRTLADGDISEKSPGDLVTIADIEAERALTEVFARLTPGAVIVGEEAVAAEPGLADRLAGAEIAWTIDPIDGTANFVAGSADYGVMVSIVVSGEPVMAWIYLPATDTMVCAERGAGTTRDQAVVRNNDQANQTDELVAVLKTRYLSADARHQVEISAHKLRAHSKGTMCAATDYDNVINAETDFILWGLTHAWDHAPGCLILEEAGGKVARLDGSTYMPGDGRFGLLVARGPQTWAVARHQFLGELTWPIEP